MNNLVFISTHIINKAVISEYIKMLKVKNIDCILAIDNSNLKLDTNGGIEEKEFFGTKVKCIFFDQNISNKLNLPNYYENCEAENFAQVMWYNSDYRFFYVKNALPDYEYYWQFEYDVYCNGDSYSEFFNKYYQSDKDLLICNLRSEKINDKWYWAQNVDWAYSKSKVYGSFFPICRMSSRAIDFLYNKRLERFRQYMQLKNKLNFKWLFGELFVPTELINNNYTAQSIEDWRTKYKGVFDKRRFVDNTGEIEISPKDMQRSAQLRPTFPKKKYSLLNVVASGYATKPLGATAWYLKNQQGVYVNALRAFERMNDDEVFRKGKWCVKYEDASYLLGDFYPGKPSKITVLSCGWINSVARAYNRIPGVNIAIEGEIPYKDICAIKKNLVEKGLWQNFQEKQDEDAITGIFNEIINYLNR